MSVSLSVSSKSENIPKVTIEGNSLTADVNLPEHGDYTITATAVGYIPGPICTGYQPGPICTANTTQTSSRKAVESRYKLVGRNWVLQEQ